MEIDKSCGRLEEATEISKVLEGFQGKTLVATLIPNAKHHNGQPMIHICEEPGNDISLYHLEVSKHGVFAYMIDDGAS